LDTAQKGFIFPRSFMPFVIELSELIATFIAEP
jgi:hypothetical protein